MQLAVIPMCNLGHHQQFWLQILKDPTVCEIAEKYENSPAQILLRWAVQQNISTYIKAHSYQEK